LSVASDSFDAANCVLLKKLLLAQPAPQQHQENFTLLIANVLSYGWNADFDAVVAALTTQVTSPALSQQRIALLEALISLADAARWDLDSARTRSRSALRRTVHGLTGDALHDCRVGELARMLAAATCFIIGDRLRAECALSDRLDPGHRYRTLLSGLCIDTERFPALFRGFAEFVRVAYSAANAVRPRHGLTPAELVYCIMQMLSYGGLRGHASPFRGYRWPSQSR
jgi:hypothetical protein